MKASSSVRELSGKKINWSGVRERARRGVGGSEKMVRNAARTVKLRQEGPLKMWFKDGACQSYFVFLMFKRTANGGSSTCIELSQEPVDLVHRYNSETRSTGANLVKHRRGGRTVRGRWFLQLVVGPLEHREDAEKLKQVWTKSTRSLRSRATFGVKLARTHRLACWDVARGGKGERFASLAK